VLDEWFESEVQPRLKGRSFLTRFADDFVIGCELEADAQKIMASYQSGLPALACAFIQRRRR